MDNKAIEQTAVSTIERRANLTDFISSFLDDNDKTPSWDGFLYVYSNAHKIKDNIVGRVAVQVKGREFTESDNAGEFERDSISYSIEITHLNRYLNDGGAILFVVYLRPNKNHTDFDTRPYYIELTPVRIMNLLKECKYGQKEKTLCLKTLPEDPVRFSSMVLNCHENCKKQASFAGAELPSVKELKEKGILESLSFPVSAYGKSRYDLMTFLESDIYLYANIVGNPIPQPVKTGEMSEKTISYEVDSKITINGKEYFQKVKRILTAKKAIVCFGCGISIEFDIGKPGCQFVYKMSNMIREYVTDTPFIVAFKKYKAFAIDDATIDFHSQEHAFDAWDIDRYEHDYHILSRCVEMFDQQGCTDDLDFTKLTTEDWNNLKRLITSTLDKEPVLDLTGDIYPIMNIPVGTLNFAVSVVECTDKPGAYYLYNAFDIVTAAIGPKVGDENIPVPVCAILKTGDLVKISNLRFEQMLTSFKEFPVNSYLYEVANELLLRMVNAYDVASGKRKQVLLKTAFAFAEWLETMPPEIWDKRIAILNKYQIIKRQRNLNEKEKGILTCIVVTTIDREDILFGAYILLDEKREAERHFLKMTKETQDNMKKYPIYYFVDRSSQHLLT